MPAIVWRRETHSRRWPIRARLSWHAATQWVVGLGGIAVLIWQVPPLVAQVREVATNLAHMQSGWLLGAVGAGVAALVTFGELHRRVLMVGGRRLRFLTVQAISFAENALSTTLPAVGNAAGFGYAAYQLRQRGVDLALATWSVVLSGLVSTVVLLVLGVVGLGWTGPLPIAVSIALALVIGMGTWVCWIAVTHRAFVRACIRTVVRLEQ